MLEAEITDNGDVLVESQHLGRLEGFRFTPDQRADGPEAKALKAAAAKALAGEFESRAKKLSDSPDSAFALSLDGTLRWIGAPIAKVQASDKFLEPRLVLLADDHLAGTHREQVEARTALWLKAHVTKLLGPLLALESGEGLTGAARGIGYQVAENFGVLDRAKVADVVKGLEQQQRSELRSLGVRFGAHHIYTSGLMKPAPRALAAQLYALKHEPDATAVSDVSHLAASGRTSIPIDKAISRDLYRVAGFRIAGERAVRVDILERLADLIRPALAWRDGGPGEAPAGAFPGGGFTITGAMTSLVGCSGDDFASILASLGYRKEMKPAPKPKPTPAAPAEAVEAEAPAAESAEAEVQIEADAPAEAQTEAAAEAAAELPVPAAAEETPPAEVSSAEIAPTETTEAAPVEPELIAVWRPGRPDHERRRHHHPRGQDRNRPRGDAQPARSADGRERPQSDRPQSARPPGERPQGDRPQGDRPQGDRPQGDRPQGDRPRGDRPDRNRGPRPDQKDGERKPFQGKPRGDRPPGKFGKGRDDRRDDRRDDQRERSWQSKPAPSKGPDPDSPFAKLMELKAKLGDKS